jgi:hypothetical protein
MVHMGKIEAAEEIQLLLPENQLEVRKAGVGSMLIGLGFLIVAVPYWTARLIGSALWRDARRIGRALDAAGSIYSDALTRR